MKETGYIPGEWKAVCDVCGFDFLASQLRMDWKGRRVCKDDFETRHPQEFVRARPEKITPDWTRPAEKFAADITANSTIANDEDQRLFSVDATGGNVTVTLPTPATTAVAPFVVAPFMRIARVDTSGNTVTVSGLRGGASTTIDSNVTLIVQFINGAFDIWGRIG